MSIQQGDNNYGISADLLRKIKGVFKNYPVEKALLFGSRARGNYQRTSDIDIAVYGKNLNSRLVNLIKNELETINTAYSFDLLDLAILEKKGLKDNIEKEGVIIYDQRK